jgi:eukaryotic-like serine/threonine-protein kinase
MARTLGVTATTLASRDPLSNSAADERTRLASISTPTPPYASDDEARAFLQERLAYLGKVSASLGLSFYIFGNLVAVGYLHGFSQRLTHLSFWIVPGVSSVYLLQWILCRRGALPNAVLRSIDGATTLLAASFYSMMVFATGPGELPGSSYSRMLLLVTFGFLLRAILVPSSARRTMLLGVLATGAPVVTSNMWYAEQSLTTVPADLHAVLTFLWCLGGVVISTLASHVIFGLRQQVRDAWQLGQYTLLEKIGEGGMGAVYRASHAMLRRPTAIKLLPPEKAGTERLLRFEREVQLTSRLTHPNTVAIFDYGRTPDGVFYYAMEYLEGLNLDDLVRITGSQPPGRVVHILRQVAASLSEAHGIGLIHRDIKPANVILVPERGGVPDVAKVVDFGLVKELEEPANVTLETRLAGTPHYLSPEAIASPDRVGPESDLYSLGCVGYYLLTGQPVFEGRTVVEVCSHHLHSRPVPPRERLGGPVPETLADVLMTCLEKRPERRPPSAAVLLDLMAACHDVAPWTSTMGRHWWNQEGSLVVAQARRERAAADNAESGPGVSSPDVSFIRPKPLRRSA